jgi:type I restriction enzyme S subunit
MNTATFLEKFDLIAEIPNAVEKMRGLVLDLAFSGKLCESKSKWKKNKLKNLTSKIGSGATPSGGRESYFSEGIPLIRSMNVHFGGFEPMGLVFLNEEQARQLSNVIVKPQDVLLNITGASIGRVTNAPIEMAGARVNQHVTIIRTSELLNPEFLAKYLASPSVQRMINEIQVGATRQALTKGMIEQFEIPIPQLEEQKRIVARVDELMALCDQLEARQKERDEKHKALCRAALARFSEDPTPANLEYLFHPSFKIPPDDLRKTILNLAVQGKLVEQDSNDEPASEITRRLEEQGRNRFEMNDSLWTCQAIPTNWEWTALGNFAECSRGRFSIRPRNDPSCYNGPYPFIQIRDLSESGGLIQSHSQSLNEKGLAISKIFKTGTVVVAIVGATIGNTGILAYDMCFPDSMVGLETGDQIANQFVELFLLARIERFRELSYSGGGQPNIKLSILNPFPLPLPPRAEQLRIVAKVEELLAMVKQIAGDEKFQIEIENKVVDVIANPYKNLEKVGFYGN